MSNIVKTLAIAAIGLSSIAVIGCETKTEGERTLDKAKKVEDAGYMITRGESMVVDGKAQITRGETLKQQGDQVEGDRAIAQGRATQKQGEALIDEGRRLRK